MLKQASLIFATVAVALSAGAFINLATGWNRESQEKGLQLIGLSFLLLAALPVGIYLSRERLNARLGKIALIVSGTVLVLLMSLYFAWAAPQVMFPADVLIWSESDFVNDIVKFRQGYPIFTDDANNESFTYVPGTQLTTYFLAWAVGLPTSISAYRAVQILFTLLAAFFALLCCRRLVSLTTSSGGSSTGSNHWTVVWFAGLFLIACNSITNPFVHLLHNDSLAQLMIVIGFWLLLEYEATGDRRILWVMVLLPGIGFWVKQSMIVWAVIYCVYLWGFARPDNRKILALFTLGTIVGVATSIGVGWLMWREHFTYWVFTVLGAHGVSPLRSFKHLLDVWIYFAAGLAAGAIVLAKNSRLAGLWLVWLFLIATETYTSGIAWMLNHIGPGTLLAGVWFFAALALVWNSLFSGTLKSSSGTQRLRAGACIAALCLAFSGLGIIRVPIAHFGSDAYRYIAEIENEFTGVKSDHVLLDLGTWVYISEGTVMKDRAPTIGERGHSQTGNFSGILTRLSDRYYEKILVRNLHSDDFWYDHATWTRSSDIRKTLLANYIEVGTIKEVSGIDPNQLPYGFNRISILVPRAD